MKKKSDLLYNHLRWLELIIAVVLTAAMILLTGRIALELWQSAGTLSTMEIFDQMLSQAFLLVIGVEFIKMIIRPTSENVLEVIMLTIARSLIMDHASMGGCLLGVAALFLLFFIRKFLFCEIRAEHSPVKAFANNTKRFLPGTFSFTFSRAKDTEGQSEKTVV